MKILYYSSHPQLRLNSQSGPGTHMRETISALRSLGHQVVPVIIGDTLHSETVSETKGNGGFSLRSVIKLLVPKILWRSLKELQLQKTDKFAEKFLSESVKEFGPDLIYERGAYMQLSGINVARKSNLVHFMELNAPFIDEVKTFEKARTLWLRKAMQVERLQVQSPDMVYVVSSALKGYYSNYISDPEKIKVVPNSVNPEYLVVDEVKSKNLREEFQLSNKQLIGFVGSIFPYHGVDILIRAFHVVSKEFADITLVIVGDGSILKDLKKLSTELKMDDRIIFTGSKPHSEVFTLIDMMDICVMANSNWYGSPVKLFEYGAMGKAIIAPNTIPVQDVMSHNEDGILINPSDSELRDALQRLLRDDSLKNRLSSHFRDKVLREHTWKKTAERIIGDYKKVALGKGKENIKQ